MGEKSLFYRYRFYALGVGALTLIALILRSLSLLLAFDTNIGYFTTDLPIGRFLIYFLYIMEALGIVGCCCLPFLTRKGELPQRHACVSLTGRVAAGISALLFAAVAIYLLTQIKLLPCPAMLTALAAICAGVAAAYFALQCLAAPSTSPALGYGVILAAALLLSITYFDRYTQMNAPHKIGLHVCLLSIMVVALYEIRALINRAAPRALGVTSALCFFLCATIGVSDLIAFLAGVYSSTLYLMIDLLVTGFAFYIACRTGTDLQALTPTTSESKQNNTYILHIKARSFTAGRAFLFSFKIFSLFSKKDLTNPFCRDIIPPLSKDSRFP